MNKYLVCIDLDSTFLNNEREISEYSKAYVKRFVEKGNAICRMELKQK